MTDNDTKKIGNVDWHSGFYGAIGLEFIENDDDLTLIDEHRLNHQPIRIDLLVVKKNRKIQIANELGAAFRGHNVMEYKSEDDTLSIDTVFHAKAKEDFTMNEYMREFYKDEIEASALAATIDNIRKMMKNLNLSKEAAMKALDIKETDFPKYMAML